LPNQKSTQAERPECQVVSRGIHARGREVKAIDKRPLQWKCSNTKSHQWPSAKDWQRLSTNSKGNSKFMHNTFSQINLHDFKLFKYLSLSVNLQLRLQKIQKGVVQNNSLEFIKYHRYFYFLIISKYNLAKYIFHEKHKLLKRFFRSLLSRHKSSPIQIEKPKLWPHRNNIRFRSFNFHLFVLIFHFTLTSLKCKNILFNKYETFNLHFLKSFSIVQTTLFTGSFFKNKREYQELAVTITVLTLFKNVMSWR